MSYIYKNIFCAYNGRVTFGYRLEPPGKNHERLYILRGGARRARPAGAYDARNGLRGMAFDDATSDAAVEELLAWIRANLDDEAQGRLIEQLATKPARAMDDDPSLDPMQTKRIAPGQAKAKAAMDAIVAEVLAKQFPGIEKIEVQPMQTSPRKSVVATDWSGSSFWASAIPALIALGSPDERARVD